MDPRALDTQMRVLIVDKSPLARNFIQSAVEQEPGFKVVGTARDGQVAIARCRELRPDIVTLDIEMPILDGLSSLPRLLEVDRDLAVIMVSSLTRRGARETVDALMAGALDYVTKPRQADSREHAIAQFSAALLPKLRAAAARRRTSMRAVRVQRSHVPVAKSQRLSAVDREPSVLAIGSSTGGPAALGQLLSSLPRRLSAPILIVQHMPATFTRLLAERLSERSPFKVREAVAGEVLREGDAWVAPGNLHMTVERGLRGELRLRLSSEAPVNFCRPSVDVLFESLARAAGQRSLAVVLTGMGHDGREGARAIRQAGGRVIVQDEASSVVWGMPRSVIAAGLAQGTFSLDQMADEILVRVGHGPESAAARIA